MKRIKIVCKYLSTLLTIIFFLIILMVLILKSIPRNLIESNLILSIDTLKANKEEKLLIDNVKNSEIHVYADEILLNMIYCMDGGNPLESILLSKYYNEGEHPSLEKAIENNSYGNQQYLRYWHGSTIIIRPLLILFNISQIYYFFAIVLTILLLTLIYKLAKKKMYLEIIALIIALILTSSQFVPFCLEYIWTYLIMLIVSILGISFASKENYMKKINMLMFVTGILTCYFDFLSTETLTFSVPILFIFLLRNKEKKIESIKQEIKQIIIWMILWFIGYAIMWGAKWLISSLILNINALEFVKDNLMLRIKDKRFPLKYRYLVKLALKTNVEPIFPLKLLKNNITKAAIVSIIVFTVAFIKKDKKEWVKSLIVFGIGLIPYIRDIAIAQHSYGHYFFTFRAQLVTIIAIIIGISILIDKSKFKKNIRIGKRKKDE